MAKKRFVIAYRLLFGGITLAAIITQLCVGAGRRDFSIVNFFSYFTILSNLLVLGVFLYGAWRTARGKAPSREYELVRGASVVYMTITGLVVVFILSKYQESLDLTLPWVDAQLHEIMPIVAVLDWIFVAPQVRLRLKEAAWWLWFPFLYGVYSLVRGPVVYWYPYPFFNPDKMHGYGRVAVYCVIIFISFVAVGSLTRWVGNALAPRTKRARG